MAYKLTPADEGFAAAAQDDRERNEPMMTLAHTAHDGTRTYRNNRGHMVAFAGSAEAIAHLLGEYPEWHGAGSSTQPDGLFVMVYPVYSFGDVPLERGAEPWSAMDRADIAEFTGADD